MTYDISNIWQYDLRQGASDHPRNGACLFDAGMWLVYGKIGDNPPCSCPIIRNYAITLNDRMPDDIRQLLKPFILRVVGNRDTEAEPTRLHFIILETARRVVLPALSKTAPKEAASALRNLTDNATYDEIRRTCSNIAHAAAAANAAHAATHAAYTATHAAHAATYASTHAACVATHAAYDAAHAAYVATHAAANAAYGAAHAAVNAATWKSAISILDGALRIGKQSPEFDEDAVIAATEQFELARAREPHERHETA